MHFTKIRKPLQIRPENRVYPRHSLYMERERKNCLNCVFYCDFKIQKCCFLTIITCLVCTVTSDGLQAGVNALHEFCMINHLTVNRAKSKVMYISRKIKRNLPVIYYNEKPLEWVEDFKYLVVHFAKNGKLTNANIYQQAACAQTTLDLHVIKHPSVSLHHILE